METKTKVLLNSKTLNVIGNGPPPGEPTAIGKWLAMPADQYDGKIPKQAFDALSRLVASGEKVTALLVLDDLEKVQEKREREGKKKEMTEKAAKLTLAMLALPVLALGFGFVGLLAALVAWDPILVACLETGEWICCGEAWYD
jgi:hypothetical protein